MSAMRAARPGLMTRTPLSKPMLIRFGNDWQVCYKAKGKLDDVTIVAWVYGREGIFFCTVGEEAQIVDLPQPDEKPFFGDQFVFTVEEVDNQDVRLQRLGGATNVLAARALFNTAMTHAPRVRLREGSRVIGRAAGGKLLRDTHG